MTRRSLIAVLRTFAIVALALSVAPQPVPAQKAAPVKAAPAKETPPTPYNPYPPGILPRSEEHTSELQSRLHLVCRLLLEKKNKSITVLSQASAFALRRDPVSRD